MRKTLLTIATIGLLGLSTMSGAFAQTAADLEGAAAAANLACGPGGNADGCLAAVLTFKAVLARSVGVTLAAPLVVNGVTIAPAGTTITRTAAVSVYSSFVAQIEVVATAAIADTALISSLNVEIVATEEDIAAASAS
jgi:hypothetical protein